MKINKTALILILIVALAFFLRVYKLGVVPPSPDWDEAALGYNAYSILKTGRDEYGKFLPLVFRSFDDYKPPLYIYLTVPAVALFGLNVSAVRLPSAVLGTLTVLLTFLLVRRLFENSVYKNKLALISAFLLAISPWHLQFSRVAFETNAALFFNVTGVWLFLEALNKPKLYFLSAVFFGLAPYTYHSARVFTPLLILGLLVVFRTDILRNKKWAFSAGGLLFFMMVPLMLIMLSPEGRMRLKGVSVIADQINILRRDTIKIEDDQKNRLPLASVIHNRRLTYGLLVIDGYLRHYDIKWLFFDGDNKRHHAPGVGLLYLWELPFFLYGLYQLFFSEEKKARNFVFWWFLAAPIAAAPTTELPHAVRTLTFLPTFQIIVSLGIVHLFKNINCSGAIYGTENKIGGKSHRYILIPAIIYIFFIIFNIIYYFHQYYVHLSPETSQYWQYGYKELVGIAKNEYPNYDKIVVSKNLEEPHMFFLFYLKYDPVKYLAGGGTTPGGFASEYKKFDKFEFRPLDENKEKFDGRTLFIGTPRELTKRYKSVYHLDGSEMARIVGK